jgi:leucyl-tRNA synthetase
LTAQKQWIGKSSGASIIFPIDSKYCSSSKGAELEVFTTRPDTLMGVTYVVIAPESPMVAELTSVEQKDKVRLPPSMCHYNQFSLTIDRWTLMLQLWLAKVILNALPPEKIEERQAYGLVKSLR